MVSRKYFRNKGYYVINDEFDLFSNTSKYKVYNDIISLIVGEEKINNFRKVSGYLYEENYKIENIDLFVFDACSFFFAEGQERNPFSLSAKMKNEAKPRAKPLFPILKSKIPIFVDYSIPTAQSISIVHQGKGT